MLNEGYLNENYHYFHLKDTAGQERDFHFHEFDKIVILLSGHVDYAVENEVYSLKPWDVLLVKHHTIHKAIISKSEPYDRIIVYLNDSYYSSFLPDAELTRSFEIADKSGNCLFTPNEDSKSELISIIENYEYYQKRNGKNDLHMLATLIVQLLITINNLTPEEGAFDTVNDEKISLVLNYINENPTQSFTIDELSSVAYVSKYHFMRLFKACTGVTVHNYIRQRRLIYASRLIREGIPISKAAQMSGFDDYSVFYKAFKSEFGISPNKLKSS